VDYQKIDPALAFALRDAPDPESKAFVVFISTEQPPNQAEKALLDHYGARGGAGARIFTATLSAQDVDSLSEQPWVRSVKLSSKLRPLTS
jgi:hypothetical protein